jgi:hypothetical protein
MLLCVGFLDGVLNDASNSLEQSTLSQMEWSSKRGCLVLEGRHGSRVQASPAVLHRLILPPTPGTDQHLEINLSLLLHDLIHQKIFVILFCSICRITHSSRLRYCLPSSFAAFLLSSREFYNPATPASPYKERFEKQREALRERKHIASWCSIAPEVINIQVKRFPGPKHLSTNPTARCHGLACSSRKLFVSFSQNQSNSWHILDGCTGGGMY